ncbi:MAG: sulfurtransferase TusA family protein, partial [Gemmatimonadetes bacterium]|nr:sulfurtransferase TusA family protein [Gemmatimonadota bacterium]
TDRGSIVDFPAWCEDTGNELLEWHQEDDGLVFFIKKVEEEEW